MANQTLTEFLQDIADAIRQKRGISGYPINAQQFATMIQNIPTPSETTIKDLMQYRTNGNYLFANYSGPELQFPTNISSVVQNYWDINYMFYNSNITHIPYTKFFEARNADYAFARLDNLQDEELWIQLTSCQNLNYTFYQMTSAALKKIKVSTASQLHSMSHTFDGAIFLETIDLSIMRPGSDWDYTFANTFYLKTLIIRNIPDNMPPHITPATVFQNSYHMLGIVGPNNPDGLKDGRIYIPDEAVDRAREYWTEISDIILPLSVYQEE